MIDMLIRDTDRYFALRIGHFHAISGPPSIGLGRGIQGCASEAED
jgi:hypothetical protein